MTHRRLDQTKTKTEKERLQMKIVMEESLAAIPKFILEVKDGIILFFNEHAPYPDGWYWRTDAGPFNGPFESIDDAGEAAAIASDPGVEEAGSRKHCTILPEAGCRS